MDILRAVAVALVLWRHAPPYPENLHPLLRAAVAALGRGGWVGVDLFFVLSGFLVSSLLFKEMNATGGFRILHFYIRRGFRIYPPFYAFIAFTIAMRWLLNAPIIPLNVAAEVFFFQNYAAGLWGHTWSLGVEEHFYFILPLLLAGIQRFWPGPPGGFFRGLPWVVGSAAVIVPIWRVHTPAHNPINFFESNFPTHLRIDSLFFGVLIAHVHNSKGRAALLRFSDRWESALLGAGVLGLVPAFLFPLESTHWISTFGFTLFYLASGSIIVGALSWPTFQSKFAIFAAYLGSHSYSIYLWHLAAPTWFMAAFRRFLEPRMESNYYLETAFYFLCAPAVGLGFSLLLEKPVLKLRDALFPSRNGYEADPAAPETTPEPAGITAE